MSDEELSSRVDCVFPALHYSEDSEMQVRLGVVPGILVRLTSEKLAAHLRSRADYHNARAKEKSEAIPKIETSIKALEEAVESVKGVSPESVVHQGTMGGKMSSSNSYGFRGETQLDSLQQQIENLRRDIESHTRKAKTFQFLADNAIPTDHVFPWNDLVLLEFISRD